MFRWRPLPSFILFLLIATACTAKRPVDTPVGTASTAASSNGNVGSAAGGSDTVLELYMHNILGGSSPTARPITGRPGNTYNGQVPFARSNGFFPPKNSANPTDTGLSGTAVLQTPHGPVSTGQIQTQLGPDGPGLGCGTIKVIDNVLTNGPDHGSQPIGKAQGVYVASSSDGTTQMMAFTVVMEGGDNFNLFGVYNVGSTTPHLWVTGGTGKFKASRGYAEVRPLFPNGQKKTDKAETLLRINVHLTY